MKPWEETWAVVETVVSRDDGQWLARFSPSPGVSPDFEAARARMAAQAPEMARMLLRLQHAPENGGACAWCGCMDCYPDCELGAVLRAAGVVQ